jgi:hypothetical protein
MNRRQPLLLSREPGKRKMVYKTLCLHYASRCCGRRWAGGARATAGRRPQYGYAGGEPGFTISDFLECPGDFVGSMPPDMRFSDTDNIALPDAQGIAHPTPPLTNIPCPDFGEFSCF